MAISVDSWLETTWYSGRRNALTPHQHNFYVIIIIIIMFVHEQAGETQFEHKKL